MSHVTCLTLHMVSQLLRVHNIIKLQSPIDKLTLSLEKYGGLSLLLL